MGRDVINMQHAMGPALVKEEKMGNCLIMCFFGNNLSSAVRKT
jgi:hypothetical protein